MLQVDHLKKQYDHAPLLTDVSFSVQERETVCLLGESGSGKSTILQIIAGLEKADSGDVRWDGLSINDLKPEERHFGLMFQDYSLFPHLSVLQNVTFSLSLRHNSRAIQMEKAKRELDRVHLWEFRDRGIADLSGGEQQRVALARTLVSAPGLMMFDEPLSALDRSLRSAILNEIRLILRETGIPAIYVTHDQEEAFAIGDKLLLLRNGKIIQEGTPEQVFNHPYDADTARFFGYESIINGVICDRSIGLIETRLGSLTISSDQLMNHRTGDRVDLILRNGRLDRTDDTDFLLFGKVTDIEFKEAGWLVRMVIRDESLAFHLPQKFILGESISIFIPIREIIVL